MKQVLKLCTLVIVATIVLTYYKSESQRMRGEEVMLVEIANICDMPVKYVRMEGLSGLRFVNVVWIPQTVLTTDRLEKLESCLVRLPRVDTIVVDEKTMSRNASATFRSRHPEIFVGRSIGFTHEAQYQFAYPTKSDSSTQPL